MGSPLLRTLTTAALGALVRSQELIWQVSQTVDAYSYLARSFGDLDHDGCDDLLSICYLNFQTAQEVASIRVLSGANGTVLDDNLNFTWSTVELEGISDFDRDGYPDYAFTWDGQGSGIDRVYIWSPHLHQSLLILTGSRPASFGYAVAGNVDLDGDGLPDLIVASTHTNYGVVYAYDHFGTVRYSIPIQPRNAVVLEVLGLPDLDADGCSDFLIGGVEYNLGHPRGYVLLVSGRTGTFMRVHFDETQGDLIGLPLARAGDLDHDGIEDYATGNYWGGSGTDGKVIWVYSGANGAILRRWNSQTSDIATSLLGGRDADLDGFPDVIAGSVAWNNNALNGRQGRMQVFSARDRQLLLFTRPPEVNAPCCNYARWLADLGVQPGNPHPVVAFTHDPGGTSGVYRVEAWRLAPPSVRMVGTGCSSTSIVPTIGVRRTDTSSGEGARIVLGSAPIGATAWCVAAHVSESSFQGAPLPLALDPLGFPGCSLLVPPTLVDSRTTGAVGADYRYAGIDLPFQLANNTGMHVAAQWLVFDFASSSFAASPRCEFHVQ